MSVLVIAEHDNEKLNPATLNALAAAGQIDASVDVLVAGNNCQAVADAAAACAGVALGVDRLLMQILDVSHISEVMPFGQDIEQN